MRTTATLLVIYLVWAGLGSAQMIVRDGEDPSKEYMRVTKAGNVGIGVTEPGATLQINGTNDSLHVGGFYGSSESEIITRAGIAVRVPTITLSQNIGYFIDMHTGVYATVEAPDVNDLYMNNAAMTAHIYRSGSNHLAMQSQLGVYNWEPNDENPLLLQKNLYGAKTVLDADEIQIDIGSLSDGKAVAMMATVNDNAEIYGPFENVFAFAARGAKSLFLDKVGIGNSWNWSPQFELDVDGDIRATGSVYYGAGAGTPYTKPDFVFSDRYDKLELDEIEKFIEKNHHLPWATPADEEDKNLIDMTRMAFETLETVENLQLQILSLNKRIKELERQNERLLEKEK